ARRGAAAARADRDDAQRRGTRGGDERRREGAHVALERVRPRAPHDLAGARSQPLESRAHVARARAQLPDAAREDPLPADREARELTAARPARPGPITNAASRWGVRAARRDPTTPARRVTQICYSSACQNSL